MRYLLFAATMMFLILVGSNCQLMSNESGNELSNRAISIEELPSLPSEMEWEKAAAESNNSNPTNSLTNAAISLNDLHFLPAETEWVKAGSEGRLENRLRR